MPPGAPFREGAGEVRLSFGYVSLSVTPVTGGVRVVVHVQRAP